MSAEHRPPVLLAFGLHAHQPVGNFDHVFEEHVRDVYEPFLEHAEAGGFLPLTLHLSGPLLDWMESHRPDYLDRVGRLAADGSLELLLSGYYEPILPSLPREDRLQQIHWMRDALRNRFGVEARGLWLTERVWEPELAEDLAAAGVGYVLVDDRHFVAAGFSREQLHSPFRTESGGRSLGVFAIDEKLRYLLPFLPPEDSVAYLRELRAGGRYLAVAADDIEKFGGWPGTREWVYDRGWLDGFVGAMKEMEAHGEIRLATFSQALAELPSGGLAYLPSASYREMEEWALPTEGQRRLLELKEELGEERFARGESPLIRGSHWRNFLVKYPEANLMHKKMLALSALCRERGDPGAARLALGRAQCNDAYWHGVFGGLYLRHIRDSLWHHLADAEGRLREGEGLAWERADMDMDGHPELWIHSSSFSALVSPERGGAVEELTHFGPRVNLANTLTRRREAYHDLREEEGAGEGEPGHPDGEGEAGSGTPSIHDLEERLHFLELPPVDLEDRALFVERVFPGDVTEDSLVQGSALPLHSWARLPLRLEEIRLRGGAVLEVGFRDPGPRELEKRLLFREDGEVELRLWWSAEGFPLDAFFSTELSLGGEAEIQVSEGAEVWRYPVATFSKSERGFDRTVQGEAVVVRWPVAEGEGWVRVGAPPRRV